MTQWYRNTKDTHNEHSPTPCVSVRDQISFTEGQFIFLSLEYYFSIITFRSFKILLNPVDVDLEKQIS